MSKLFHVVIAFPLLVGLMGTDCSCKSENQVEAGDTTTLPAPRLSGDMSLEEVLKSRRSVREYGPAPLTMEEISQLFWAAQGITGYLYNTGLRTAPSAGALYPLEIYMVIAEGVYHYSPGEHEMSMVKTGDVRADLCAAGLNQEPIQNAPAVFVITAVYARTEIKYEERAERYVRLEAGHACQNILLQVVALGLCAVPIGAFDDEQVKTIIAAPADHEPLYLIPVGHPR